VTADAKTLAKEDRRQQILNAALAVFAKKGYGEATIPGIAGQAGVAVGTIYHYYESKHDLLVSLIDNYVNSDALREIFAELAREDDKTSVRGIIENGLDWAADDLRGFLFIFTEVLRDPELGEHFSEKFLASLLQSLEEYVAERVSSAASARSIPRWPHGPCSAWSWASSFCGNWKAAGVPEGLRHCRKRPPCWQTSFWRESGTQVVDTGHWREPSLPVYINTSTTAKATNTALTCFPRVVAE